MMKAFFEKNQQIFEKSFADNEKGSIFAPPKSDSGWVTEIETEKSFDW